LETLFSYRGPITETSIPTIRPDIGVGNPITKVIALLMVADSLVIGFGGLLENFYLSF